MRAEEGLRRKRGPQEQQECRNREDEDWGGLPRREEEGYRNRGGGAVVVGEGLRRNTRRGG